MTDESWPMIEQAVYRLFDEAAGNHTAIAPRLAELGWSDIESEYPVEACELLFRAQGRSLAHTDCLDRVLLAELAAVLDEPANAVVMPTPADGCTPGSQRDRVSGIALGPLQGRVVVPVSGVMTTVSLAVVDADTLDQHRLDTFDPSVHWTMVSGPLDTRLIEAPVEWNRALAAAHRALATELVSLTTRMLDIAVEHAKSRIQFGAPVGSFQSPRHALAQACAAVEGSRALLEESWRYGGQLLALTAKAAAGRAHRAVADTALQVCAAIGLTAEHDLHRYVSRGFQIDALFGSHQQLERSVAEQLFSADQPTHGLPTVVVCG
jgi:hypothetical protein